MANLSQASSHEPIREVIAGWQAEEDRLASDYGASLDALESAVRELEAIGTQMEQRLADTNATIEQEREQWRQQQEAESLHRQRLEHDLSLARSRVVELERHLQQRTEELLEAQSANNALAAQLQASGDAVPPPLPAPSSEVPAQHATDVGGPSESGGADAETSVSERFARLRNKPA